MSDTPKWPSGPYAISKFGEIIAAPDGDGDDFVLARVGTASPLRSSVYTVPNDAQIIAVRRLFVAAPDLYEALDRLASTCWVCRGFGRSPTQPGSNLSTRPPPDCPACAPARAVLARAKGEPQ